MLCVRIALQGKEYNTEAKNANESIEEKEAYYSANWSITDSGYMP